MDLPALPPHCRKLNELRYFDRDELKHPREREQHARRESGGGETRAAWKSVTSKRCPIGKTSIHVVVRSIHGGSNDRREQHEHAGSMERAPPKPGAKAANCSDTNTLQNSTYTITPRFSLHEELANYRETSRHACKRRSSEDFGTVPHAPKRGQRGAQSPRSFWSFNPESSPSGSREGPTSGSPDRKFE